VHKFITKFHSLVGYRIEGAIIFPYFGVLAESATTSGSNQFFSLSFLIALDSHLALPSASVLAVVAIHAFFAS
jgi:hypothetical protein